MRAWRRGAQTDKRGFKRGTPYEGVATGRYPFDGLTSPVATPYEGVAVGVATPDVARVVGWPL